MYDSKQQYIRDFISSNRTGYTVDAFQNLKATMGTLYSYNQPIATKWYNYLFVDSASHNFKTNLDIIAIKQAVEYRENSQVIELNFREAGYLLTGTFSPKSFIQWLDEDVNAINRYIVETTVFVIESEKKSLVVGYSSMALKEFSLFLGVIDTAAAMQQVVDAFDNVVYNDLTSFFMGNLLCSPAEDVDSTLLEETDVTDICKVFKATTDALTEYYAVGRVNHKWYPKRLELDGYFLVEPLPIRFVK